jgi:hypothetical protein
VLDFYRAWALVHRWQPRPPDHPLHASRWVALLAGGALDAEAHAEAAAAVLELLWAAAGHRAPGVGRACARPRLPLRRPPAAGRRRRPAGPSCAHLALAGRLAHTRQRRRVDTRPGRSPPPASPPNAHPAPPPHTHTHTYTHQRRRHQPRLQVRQAAYHALAGYPLELQERLGCTRGLAHYTAPLLAERSPAARPAAEALARAALLFEHVHRRRQMGGGGGGGASVGAAGGGAEEEVAGGWSTRQRAVPAQPPRASDTLR